MSVVKVKIYEEGYGNYLNPSRYSLLTSKSSVSLSPNRYALSLNSGGSGAKSFLRSLFQKTQPLLQSYIQYKIAKQRLRWHAKLMQQAQGSISLAPPSVSNLHYSNETIMNNVQGSDKTKYLLLGGAALAGLLLVMLTTRG